jgi:CDP-diglyceride synthetase
MNDHEKKSVASTPESIDLLRRLVTVSIGAPIAIVLLTHETYSCWLIQAVHLICALEWLRLVPKKSQQDDDDDKNHHARLITETTAMRCIFTAVSLLIAASQEPPFVLLALAFGILTITKSLVNSPHEAAAIQHFQNGTVFLSVGFYHLLQISTASKVHAIYFIMIVWNCDTGALLSGKMNRRLFAGKKNNGEAGDLVVSLLGLPLSLKKNLNLVSPQKTVTGIVGGLFLGMLTAICFPSVIARSISLGTEMGYIQQSATLQQNLLTFSEMSHFAKYSILTRRSFVGLAISSAGLLGDLVESCVKRSAGVKDAGKLLPGHGGLMDRMDSALLSSIVYFWCFLQPS